MYIMCLIIFEEKAEIQDQYSLSLNPVQKADDPESGSEQKYRAIDTLLSYPLWYEFSNVFVAQRDFGKKNLKKNLLI